MEKKLYTVRDTIPTKDNKWYTKGGYLNGVSPCILGEPAAWEGSVLANCTGYAFGRFCEMHGELLRPGCWPPNKYPGNAKSWFAAPDGFERGQKIRVGAIACWKSNLPSGSGHVAIVEKIVNDKECFLSDSAWKGAKFRYYPFSNDMSKRGYTFLGFIYPKYDFVTEMPKPTKTLDELAQEVIDGKWGNNPHRKQALTEKHANGEIAFTYDQIQERVNQILVEREAAKNELKVGDKVKITRMGNSQADGKGNHARSGLVRYILKIHKGAAYPYQVGNSTGTTGFYKKEALQKM